MSDPTSEGDAPHATSPMADASALLETMKSKKNEFDSFVSTSTSSIQAEVAKAKTAASEAEKLKTDVATAKGAIDATQKSATDELGIVTQSRAEIEKLKASATALSEKLTTQHEAVATQITALQEQHKALQTVLADVTTLKAGIQSESEVGKASAKEIEAAKAAVIKLNAETQAQHDTLVSKQSALQSKISEIEDANTKIIDLRQKLLESSDARKSVQDQVAALHGQIQGLLKEITAQKTAAASELAALQEKSKRDGDTLAAESRKRFDDLHASLEAKILALLPSAGAAGLASTYYDAKSRYSPTSFSGKPGGTAASGWFGRVRSWFGYNPASVVATAFFYAMFVLPLCYIVYESVLLLAKLESEPHIVLDYRMLVIRFLIVIPLAAISGFGFASLQLYRRLYEEYNHKQRVMELYQSFQGEIEKNGDEEQKKALLSIMLGSVQSKAWDEAKSAADKKPVGMDILGSLEKLTDDIGRFKAAIMK